MNILITGASGFIGKNLTQSLTKDKHKIRCLVRTKDKFLQDLGVELVYADLNNKDQIKEALKNIDIVIHLAGLLDGTKEQYINTNITITKNLFESLTNQKQIIHFSTAGILGPIKNQIPDEFSSYNPTNLYEETKAIGEKIALSYKNKFNVTIIRPEFIYGPHDLHILQLFRFIKSKKFIYIGSGKNTIYPTYVQDLIQAIKLTLNNKNAFGKIYNVGGPKFVTIKEFVDATCDILKIKKPKLYVPKILAILAQPFIPIITKSRIQFFTENHGCKINEIINLGYKPKYSLKEGLTETFNWYKENKLL